MSISRALMVAAGLAAGIAGPALAHHSISGVYDVNKYVKFTGTIVKVEWINPHSFVHVDTIDAKGEKVQWHFETVPTAFFRRQGVTKEMLMGKPGEIVTIIGQPARDGTKHLAILAEITYSDGRHYKLGLDVVGTDVTTQH